MNPGEGPGEDSQVDKAAQRPALGAAGEASVAAAR